MAYVVPLAVSAKGVCSRLGTISDFDVQKGDGFGALSGKRMMGFGRNRGRCRAKMVSNGYVGGGGASAGRRESGGFKSPRIYKWLGSCLVIPPVKGRKVRGVVQFLGGAFLRLHTVPYNVTFDHLQAAKEVYDKFNACLDDELLVSGVPDYGLVTEEIAQLPIFSVGHRCSPLVSQMMPLVEASPLYSMARSASDDAWKVILKTTGQLISSVDDEILVSITKFTDQCTKSGHRRRIIIQANKIPCVGCH